MRYLIPFLAVVLILPMCSKSKQKTGELEAVEESSPPSETTKPIEGKSVLIIVAQDGFKDVEYGTTRSVLEGAGAKITVASNKAGLCKGVDGLEIKSELGFGSGKIDLSSYSAVVLIGGPGTIKYFYHNKDIIALVKDAQSQDKVIGAICLAPGVVAEAGILNGKKATVFDSSDARKLFDDNGVKYTGDAITVEGKIITANGPSAAEDFGKRLVELLK